MYIYEHGHLPIASAFMDPMIPRKTQPKKMNVVIAGIMLLVVAAGKNAPLGIPVLLTTTPNSQRLMI